MRGFTLIELLVVITIMGLLMGVGVAGYHTFNTRQIVITGGKELLVTLRRTQADMTSGVKVTQSCLNTPLLGERIQAVAGSLYQYQVIEVYSAACSGGSANVMIRTVQLPAGVTFESAFSVTFLGLAGGATLSGASPMTIRVCNSSCGAGSLKYAVAVSNSGLVQDIGTP